MTGLHPGELVRRNTLGEARRAALGSEEIVLEIKGHDRLPGWERQGLHWAQQQQEPVPKYALAVQVLNLPTIEKGVLA